MITTIVGFAISMAFLFLMLSAACSAIQEIVANLFRWRSKTLERGLANLLMSPEFKEAVYHQPLIQGLCEPGPDGKLSRRPSYIPSTTLALAILQTAKDYGMTFDGTAAPQPGNLKQTEELLGSLLLDCKNVTEQRLRLESWFNNSMDRVSGWYKRKSHAWIWVFGFILCLLLNADSISLSKRFWNDQTLRDAITAEATDYIKSTPREQVVDDKVELDQSIHRMNLLREQLPGVPLGWCFVDAKKAPPPPSEKAAVQADGFNAHCWPDLIHPTSSFSHVSLASTDPRLVDVGDWSWWLWKIVGLAATVLAISQGAPFWFDLLQKAVNLRLAGSAPATTANNK
jgi:hypothetical protein